MRLIQTDKNAVTDGKQKRIISNVDNSEYMLDKSIGGFGRISIVDNPNSIDDFWNLVVFEGREFIASKVSNLESAGIDNSSRRIAYFGVGSGGADKSDSSVRYGPTLDDTDLREPKRFTDSGINTSDNGYKYMKDGFLKKLDKENSKIEAESHEYVNKDGDTVTDDRNTVVHYTIKIEKEEMLEETFVFNEAGLYTMDYDGEGNPINGSEKLFARLTTSNKEKERNEAILIEWYVLV